MTPWELLLAAGLYASVSVRYALTDNPGMSLAWGAYAVANLGFIWAAAK